MKQIILILGLLLFPIAHAETWVHLSIPFSSSDYYIDKDSLKNQDGYVDFWYKEVDTIGIVNVVSLSIDCKHSLSSLNEVKSYDPLGRLMEHSYYPLIDWLVVDYDTPVGSVINYACGIS